MSKLYSSPLRVYLCLAILALAGIFAGLKLPISLYPNSSKPQIGIWIQYGDITADEFLNSYGRALESQLRAISTGDLEIDRLIATYGSDSVNYKVEFKWGAAPTLALREVQNTVNSFGSRFPKNIRDGVNIWTQNENSGFLAISFFSSKRSLDELYDLLEPILVPRTSKVQDALEAGLWNPSKKEIRIELNPETMASLQLFPKDIDRAIESVLGGHSGGSVTIGPQQLTIQMPRVVNAVDDLGRVLVATPSGRAVHLSDVATVDMGIRTTGTRSFKTNGAPSLILFAEPRPGGNVKRMSEEIIDIVKSVAPALPKDVEYRVLVDPSEFIRAAVNNVLHEVVIGALLAVLVLFLFIGSLRNTITAAIEIPLSMVLAFILMKLSGMNLNLISLGGLALSAGMNVDASVVVMENIFRHFEAAKGPLDFGSRLRLITQAVAEVRFAVIASTISSLVVFLPLAFTSELSYAILGDLAKTVVFSHGFSAIIALILVPTVRLQLMSGGQTAEVHSPIEHWIRRLENGYGQALGKFIAKPRLKQATCAGLVALLLGLAVVVLPRLPTEVIGTPDTDWMILGVNTRGNTILKQMEAQSEEVEAVLLDKLGSRVQYTFNQVQGPNRASLMVRLKNKSEMRVIWKEMEALFENTPLTRYWVGPWNPAELPIPDPPNLRVAIRGGTLKERALVTQELSELLQENKVFPRVWTQPDASRQENVTIKPNLEQWIALWNQGSKLSPSDLADVAHVATTGRRSAQLSVNSRLTDIMLRYPSSSVKTIEDLASLPIGANSKIVPLKALARVAAEEVPQSVYREDERELFLLLAEENEEHKSEAAKSTKKAEELIGKWRLSNSAKEGPSVYVEDAEKDLHEALKQLAVAVALSVLLIFVTLVIQFGDVMNAILVLAAIPLGFVGVLISLFVFRSTLSLNSVLGVILLNGISVANSIILVDFMKRLVDRGMAPRAAAVEAARKRLRPILITSLTTVLGMLPIALGFGEGGKILQPLGIAVSGGLWFSAVMTLFIVPALQVAYLEILGRRRSVVTRPAAARSVSSVTVICLFGCGALAVAPSAVASEINFDTALSRILDRNTNIAIQKATEQAVYARDLPTKLFVLPSLSVDANQTRGRLGSGSSYSTTRTLQATARLNLLRFGADLSALHAANADERSQGFLVAQSRLQAERAGVELLVNVIQRRMELAVHSRIVQRQTDLLKIARARYSRSLLSLQEVDKIAVDLSNAEARLHDAEIQEQQARATLESALGTNDIVVIEWPWKDRLGDENIRDLIEEPLNLARIPARQAAQSVAEAEQRRQSRDLGLIFPSIDSSFAYGHTAQNLGEVGNSANWGWTGVISFSMPLFDRLTNYSSYRAQTFARMTAELSLEQTERDAHSDWAASREGLKTALGSALARERTLGISRKLYEDNLRRFQAGRISANDFIVDQTRVSDSELLSIQGWNTAHIAYVRRCHALGRSVLSCSAKQR